MYDDLLHLKGAALPVFDEPTAQLDPQALEAMRERHPTLSAQYLEYLRTVGWGSLANRSFMIYSGPAEPQEVYGETLPGLEDTVLVGDDFQGHSVGVNLTTGAMVDVDPRGNPCELTSCFEDFIRNKIADLMPVPPRAAPASEFAP